MTTTNDPDLDAANNDPDLDQALALLEAVSDHGAVIRYADKQAAAEHLFNRLAALNERVPWFQIKRITDRGQLVPGEMRLDVTIERDMEHYAIVRFRGDVVSVDVLDRYNKKVSAKVVPVRLNPSTKRFEGTTEDTSRVPVPGELRRRPLSAEAEVIGTLLALWGLKP